jgi:hypothetical protein
MDRKARFVKILEDEFPGSTVLFDQEPSGTIRFRVDSSSRQIEGFLEHPLSDEVDRWSDERLRAAIHALCGFSNGGRQRH